MITPEVLIAQARGWVGVKFLHQGRTRNGADCLGFIAACLAELGSGLLLEMLPLNYARNPQALLVDGLERLTREITLQPAAIILIRFPGAPHASHAAIYTGESMIHAYEANGKVIEHGFTDPWSARAVSYHACPLVMYV